MRHEGVRHPGEVLNVQFLRKKRMSRKELAEKSNIAVSRINSFIVCRARIRELDAYRLAVAFPETSEDYWLQLQMDFDLYKKMSDTDQLQYREKIRVEEERSRAVARRGAPVLIRGPITSESRADQSLNCEHRSE
jgi:addiction module HigA family antidote